MGSTFPLLMLMAGMLAMLGMVFFAFSGPSAAKASNRRLDSVRERHSRSSEVSTQAQLKRILQTRQQTKMEGLAQRFIPNPALLTKRLQQTGRAITLPQYAAACLGLTVAVGVFLTMKGLPTILAMLLAVIVGVGRPPKLPGTLI